VAAIGEPSVGAIRVGVTQVRTHRAHVIRKLDLESRAELGHFALTTGLIGPGWATSL
jgi:hypothetical protein